MSRAGSEVATGDPDAQLMLAFASGDTAAYDALFDRWAERLLRFLERMVHDAATAEELVQETFLRVYRARDRYEARARFSTWLYRIATNLALNELQKPVRRNLHLSRDDESLAVRGVVDAVDVPEPGAGPEELLDSRRAGESVEAALAQLPERQRAALWLSAVEGLSYAEVAEALDATPKSIKSLVHRARSAVAAHPAVEARARRSRT